MKNYHPLQVANLLIAPRLLKYSCPGIITDAASLAQRALASCPCDRPISLASSRFDQQYDRTNSCPPPFVALGLLDIGAIPVLGDNTL